MGDISVQTLRQLSFLRVRVCPDMPPRWRPGTEAPLAHRERTAHDLRTCEDEKGEALILCQACELYWPVGQPATLVEEFNILRADRFYRECYPEERE